MIYTNAHCALYSLYSIRSLNLNHAEGTTAAVVLISNVVAHKFSVPIAGCIYEKGTQFQTQIQIEAQEKTSVSLDLRTNLCRKMTSNRLVKSSKLRNHFISALKHWLQKCLAPRSKEATILMDDRHVYLTRVAIYRVHLV